MLSNYGQVTSCKIIRDKATGISLEYDFIEFVKAESAAKILELNGHEIDYKTIQVSYSRPDIKHSKYTSPSYPRPTHCLS